MFGLLLVLIGLSALFHFAFADAAWPNYFTLGVFIVVLVLYAVSKKGRMARG
ncbi:hypothetical protein FLK61_39480 [Paenalkalicoccus suaedae]|uniref:Uncharacterized protein n=1 Tax=Paenalkalicoccus suaedae TaxID=2592382 RepID=A0A859FIJ6_9BACI|nr:hypothetical protein [Paenalkalicoccus suaedae]QKS72698.1 hypothetical protein FLK61_39480 [Paenalkalicoccus suaedae]